MDQTAVLLGGSVERLKAGILIGWVLGLILDETCRPKLMQNKE